MRHALPIVAFDAGGIREWLFDGENGFLVPWKDTGAFGRRVEQLLVDNDLARRLGRRGLQLVNQHQQASAWIAPWNKRSSGPPGIAVTNPNSRYEQ